VRHAVLPLGRIDPPIGRDRFRVDAEAMIASLQAHRRNPARRLQHG
jgi:hypothetical protein